RPATDPDGVGGNGNESCTGSLGKELVTRTPGAMEPGGADATPHLLVDEVADPKSRATRRAALSRRGAGKGTRTPDLLITRWPGGNAVLTRVHSPRRRTSRERNRPTYLLSSHNWCDTGVIALLDIVCCM